MSGFRVEDFRTSSSSIDAFFAKEASPARVASSNPKVGKIRVASLEQLAGFDAVSEDTLVRISQQDFWKLGQDSSGYFIERLVSDDDAPVKA